MTKTTEIREPDAPTADKFQVGQTIRVEGTLVVVTAVRAKADGSGFTLTVEPAYPPSER